MPSSFPSFHNVIFPSHNLVLYTKFDVEPVLFLVFLSFMSVYGDNVEINMRSQATVRSIFSKFP